MARDTPSDLTVTTGGRPRRLPDDLLRQASKRLQILALVGAALWVLGPALGHLALHLAEPQNPEWTRFRVLDGIAVFAFVTSIALYYYVGHTKRDPAFVLDLSLVYLVLTAIDLGVMFHWGPVSVAPTVPRPMISWIGPVILMTAAIVPAEPRKMLVAGFLAASMDPIGMMIGRAFGVYHFDSVLDALAMHYPNYLLAGVAVVVSGVVTKLGHQVSRARELGSYRLGELLGRGGMGEVYLATHRMLARPAAIKLIRPEALAGEDGTKAQLATARFRREAEAAARLKSPHTVQLYDFGVTDEGRLYLVMELLEGLDLDSLVRRDGPLTAARVVHILRQVCESLEEAHDAGLVHRDIKPANIHLGRVGREPDFVKVLDFGLVKSVEGAGRRGSSGHHRRHDAGHPRLHGPGDGAVRNDRRTRGPVLAGLRRLLPPDRAARLPGGHRDPDDVHAHPAGAGAAVGADGEPDPPGAGAADSHLPGQAAGGPAGERGRSGRRTGPGRRGLALVP